MYRVKTLKKIFLEESIHSILVRIKDSSAHRSHPEVNPEEPLHSKDDQSKTPNNKRAYSSVQIKTQTSKSGTTNDEKGQHTKRDSPHPKSLVDEDIQEEQFVTIEFDGNKSYYYSLTN